MLIHKLLPLFALGLNLLLVGTALAPERKSPRNVVFAYLAATLAIWNLGVLGLRWATNPDNAMVWERVLHVGVVGIPVLFYHYVLVFLDRSPRRASLVVGYLLCAGFVAATFTPALMTGVVDTSWGFAPAAGPLYAPFVLYFQAYLVAGLALLLRGYRRTLSSFKRNRTMLVILGVIVSLAGGLVDFARFIFGWQWLYPPGIPANAVFAAALGIAIVRYRLMDIGVFAKRLVLYVLASVALAPLLFVGLWVLEQLLLPRGGADGGDPLWTLARDAGMLMVVFAGALPLLRKLERGLDRLIFHRRHGVRDALVALSRELGSLLEVERLAATLTRGLVERVPVLHASFHVLDPTTRGFIPLARAASDSTEPAASDVEIHEMLAWWLRMNRRTLIVEEAGFHTGTRAGVHEAVTMAERHGIALLVPLFLEEELTAVLAVGEKVSGEIFAADEIELLETLVGETSIALRNARLYEDLRTQMDELRRTQEQLIQSAKLAAIGELAAGVAHEVNNPLTVILGMSGLLLRDPSVEAGAQRRVENIVREANRAGKIVHDLLDFARRREPDRRRLTVIEVVERALALVESRLNRGRIDVRRIFDPDVPPVLGDRDELTQVFVNLVGNAIDAMSGEGTLRVETGVRITEGGSRAVLVAVADSGPGIPSELLPRIFEPFYTTKPEGRGTGLGLSVSLGIVHRHGGTIDVESQPGKGTTVSVLLPVCEPAR